MGTLRDDRSTAMEKWIAEPVSQRRGNGGPLTEGRKDRRKHKTAQCRRRTRAHAYRDGEQRGVKGWHIGENGTRKIWRVPGKMWDRARSRSKPWQGDGWEHEERNRGGLNSLENAGTLAASSFVNKRKKRFVDRQLEIANGAGMAGTKNKLLLAVTHKVDYSKPLW